MERGLQRPHQRSSAKRGLEKRSEKEWDKANKGGCKRRSYKMSQEKSSQEVLRKCPQGRSREEVVSGGPQKRLREEASRESRLWKEAGKEVVTGGLKWGPNERDALENKAARGGREKRSQQQVIRRGPQGRSRKVKGRP